MASPDSTSARLAELRRTDATGVYASDEPADGTDPSGAVTVTIDPTNRVTAVRLSNDERIRTSAGLAEAFESAYSAALANRLKRSRAARPPRPATRPRAVATRPVFRRPTPEQLQRHRIRTETPRTAARSSPGQVVGVSANDCVQVTLAPAQSSGTVVADPGWLANASPSNIASAITEAFHAAYVERDS